MTADEIRQWTAVVDFCRMSHVKNNAEAHVFAGLIRAVDDELIRLRAEVVRLTAERDAIALMWFRELADTLTGERRLYDVVGPDIYTGVDDDTAIAAARKAAGLDATAGTEADR